MRCRATPGCIACARYCAMDGVVVNVGCDHQIRRPAHAVHPGLGSEGETWNGNDLQLECVSKRSAKGRMWPSMQAAIAATCSSSS
jgi:hypothetical protein